MRFQNGCRVALHRKEQRFDAGFCVVRASLLSLSEDLSFLHPEERAYYNSLPADRRRSSFLLGRRAAKEAIRTLTGESEIERISIGFGVFHFPVVRNATQPVQVSISHCGEVGVALAFPEEHPMGIDIEQTESEHEESIRSQLCPDEAAWIAGAPLPPSIACVLLWTIREALSKVIKTGLTIDGSLLRVRSLEGAGGLFTATFAHFSQYKAMAILLDGYACSIVLPRNTTVDPDALRSILASVLKPPIEQACPLSL